MQSAPQWSGPKSGGSGSGAAGGGSGAAGGGAGAAGGGRRAKAVASPGIPALLRGKSGGRSTFQPLSRRRPPADEATDDDLWQLDR